MRLTVKILEAIVEMSARVEAGTVEMYQGYGGPDALKAYSDAIRAGFWAMGMLAKKREMYGWKCGACGTRWRNGGQPCKQCKAQIEWRKRI